MRVKFDTFHGATHKIHRFSYHPSTASGRVHGRKRPTEINVLLGLFIHSRAVRNAHAIRTVFAVCHDGRTVEEGTTA